MLPIDRYHEKAAQEVGDALGPACFVQAYGQGCPLVGLLRSVPPCGEAQACVASCFAVARRLRLCHWMVHSMSRQVQIGVLFGVLSGIVQKGATARAVALMDRCPYSSPQCDAQFQAFAQLSNVSNLRDGITTCRPVAIFACIRSKK